MKKVRAFFIFALSVTAIAFSSCSSTNNGFQKQKYTGFKKGNGKNLPAVVKKDVSADKTALVSAPNKNTDLKNAPVTNPEYLTEKMNIVSEKSIAHESEDLIQKDKTKKVNKFDKMIHKMQETLLADDEHDWGFLAVVIMILLCIFLPPLAVLIVDGLKGPFWLDLLLFALGVGAYLYNPIAGLLLLLAIIYAFVRVF